MKNKLVHILILVLVLFQNSWAMEQTYLVFCENTNTGQELLQHDHDSDTTEHDHDHDMCDNCCHMSSPLVGITQINLRKDFTAGSAYRRTSIKHFHSITIQPPIRPPIA